MYKHLTVFKKDFLNVIYISFFSFLFCVKLFPTNLLLPSRYQWIFGTGPSIRDDAGHAIASLFYSEESWKWPLGAMTSLGGKVAGSIMYFATSPLFAILFKLIHSLGVIGPKYQFIGLQILSGIVLTNCSLYLLCRRLGAKAYSSLVISLTGILLVEPMIRWTNESLASQFIVIFALLLSLKPSDSLKRAFAWASLIFLAVGINQYFTPMVLFFILIEFFYLHKKTKKSFIVKSRNMLIGIGTFIISNYILGGFVLNALKLSTGIGDLKQFSSNLLSFFDSRGMGYTPNLSSQASWESYNYVGISFTLLILIYSLMTAYSRFKSFRYPKTAMPLRSAENPGLWWTCSGAFICFVISLGPSVQIGPKWILNIPFPSQGLELLSTFRALARFSWPAMYLLMGVAALSLDRIIAFVRIPKLRIITMVLCAVMIIGLQGFESAPLIKIMHSIAVAETKSNPAVNVDIQRVYNSSTAIEVIPPFDGDAAGIPWRLTSDYALNAHLPLTTWGFFARYDFSTAGKIQSTEVQRFENCRWSPHSLYLVRKIILNSIKCTVPFEVIQQYPPTWTLIRTN